MVLVEYFPSWPADFLCLDPFRAVLSRCQCFALRRDLSHARGRARGKNTCDLYWRQQQVIRDALSRDVSVAGLMNFLGSCAWFPPRLLVLARERQTPVVAYVMDIDYVSGRRSLRVRQLVSRETEKQLTEVVDFLASENGRNPPAWHNWPDLWAFRSRPKTQ